MTEIEGIKILLVQGDPKEAQLLGLINANQHSVPNELLLQMIDYGVSIPPEDNPKFFARFDRVDNSMTRATGGSGLGLALTKDIVEGHG